MTELRSISWTHPVHGHVNESVCPSHEGEVLRALRMLGIGCVGSMDEPGGACHRCAHRRQRPLKWIPSVAS